MDINHFTRTKLEKKSHLLSEFQVFKELDFTLYILNKLCMANNVISYLNFTLGRINNLSRFIEKIALAYLYRYSNYLLNIVSQTLVCVKQSHLEITL